MFTVNNVNCACLVHRNTYVTVHEKRYNESAETKIEYAAPFLVQVIG